MANQLTKMYRQLIHQLIQMKQLKVIDTYQLID